MVWWPLCSAPHSCSLRTLQWQNVLSGLRVGLRCRSAACCKMALSRNILTNTVRTLKLILCLYKEQLPNDADVWFWGSPLFDKLGRFAGLGDEMETITINSILAYPALQVRTASIATIKQLIAVRTGEGVVNRIWHTYGIIERYAPRLVPLMRQARQQRGATSFIAINWVQYPVALIAMALLPVIVLVASPPENTGCR